MNLEREHEETFKGHFLFLRPSYKLKLVVFKVPQGPPLDCKANTELNFVDASPSTIPDSQILNPHTRPKAPILKPKRPGALESYNFDTTPYALNLNGPKQSPETPSLSHGLSGGPQGGTQHRIKECQLR